MVLFSSSQLRQPEFKNCIFDEVTRFQWVQGYSVARQRKVFVPSQLVFVPYKFTQEKIIRLPITTGAACGETLEEAIYRGICEVVERDAFIISYLNKMPGKIVAVNGSEELKQIFEYYQSYNLTLYLIDVTTDLGIPVILGLLIDKTGLGPTVSLGAAADISPFEAVIKAAEEAQHSRPWIRREMEKGNKNKNPSSIMGRGLYWAEKKMINKLDFWLKGEKASIENQKKFLDPKKKLREILRRLKKFALEVTYVDVTRPKIRRAGFWVVRVIIPKLHPLYLEENYPYLGGERLYRFPVKLGCNQKKRKTFNPIPHPFL